MHAKEGEVCRYSYLYMQYLKEIKGDIYLLTEIIVIIEFRREYLDFPEHFSRGAIQDFDCIFFARANNNVLPSVHEIGPRVVSQTVPFRDVVQGVQRSVDQILPDFVVDRRAQQVFVVWGKANHHISFVGEASENGILLIICDWLFGCLFGCLVGWLFVCLVGWLVGWLVGSLGKKRERNIYIYI